MGINTNQIATEGNVENNTSYAGNISSSTTNTKCITVNRLLQGLIETSNTPTYNTNNTTYNNTYQIKTFAASVTTSVNLRAGYMTTVNSDSQVINGNASNYGSYPFSTGTGFFIINTNYSRTINATITVTCTQLVTPQGDDGVSPTSLDFDNPEDDNESNTSDEYPTTVNTQGSNTRCTQAGGGLDGSCTGNQVVLPCTNEATLCTTKSTCQPVSTQPGTTYAVTLTLSLQIYAGTVDGEDTYINLCSSEKNISLNLGGNTSTSITLTIPTSKVFNISGPPTGSFKFRLKMDHLGLGSYGGVGVSAKITTTVPYIAFNVYNPGPKCIKYSDLQNVYPLYGK